MNINDFLAEIDSDAQAVLDPSFNIEVYDTTTGPHFGDSYVTFDNLDAKIKKCRRLESCVLYIDIRNSASLNVDKKAWTLARLYSTFVSSMIRAAKYYGGHVRNIIGDRVMVVFDQEGCFTSAINTAILMNSIAAHIINKRYEGVFECGIGIDYGKMLIVKAGEVRRGNQTEFYRSFIWLGRPANIASRLTDLANKTLVTERQGVSSGIHYPLTDVWSWQKQTYSSFLGDLATSGTPTLTHKDPYFKTFIQANISPLSKSYSPILITEAVLDGYKKLNPTEKSIAEGWWREQAVDIKEYSGKVFGGNIRFTAVDDIS